MGWDGIENVIPCSTLLAATVASSDFSVDSWALKSLDYQICSSYGIDFGGVGELWCGECDVGVMIHFHKMGL